MTDYLLSDAEIRHILVPPSYDREMSIAKAVAEAQLEHCEPLIRKDERKKTLIEIEERLRNR